MVVQVLRFPVRLAPLPIYLPEVEGDYSGTWLARSRDASLLVVAAMSCSGTGFIPLLSLFSCGWDHYVYLSYDASGLAFKLVSLIRVITL